MLPKPLQNALKTGQAGRGRLHNTNAVRHGRRSRRFGLVIVNVAQGLRGVRGGLIGLRREWHDRAVAVHGEPLEWHVTGAIHRAADWERVRQLAQRLASKVWSDDPARALALEEQAARAGEKRDEALRLAFTPKEAADPWMHLLGEEGPQNAAEPRSDALEPGQPFLAPGGENAADKEPGPSDAVSVEGAEQ